MSTTSESDGVVASLEAARERLRRSRAALETDPESLEVLAEAHDAVVRVLDRWEDRATDWDDFSGYVEFRNDLAETLEATPEDVPEREAFVAAADHVRTSGVSKTLSSRDFEAARAALEPVRDRLERREQFLAARTSLDEAVREARARERALTDRIDDLERLLRLADADVDAPIEEVRRPVDAYNESIEAAFERFRRGAPAEAVLELVDAAASTPLVDVEAPPPDLLAYVRDREAGRRPIADLLELSAYSPSKLDHYVDDARELKRRVATNRTYLERFSAAPLSIPWPPEPADVLWFRTRELVGLVDRFADAETVAALRQVRELARREDYDRLRTAAVAHAELTEAERQTVASGRVEEELEAARESRRRVESALTTLERAGTVPDEKNGSEPNDADGSKPVDG